MAGRLLLVFIAIATFGVSPPFVKAETFWERMQGDDHTLPDRLMIRGGWAGIFGTEALVTLNRGNLGLGGTIDLKETLGMDSSSESLRIDSLFRFNKRHSVGFSWYRYGVSGQQLLEREIIVDDTVIKAGAGANTNLNLNLYRLLYNWSFYNKDPVELALSPGVYLANMRFILDARGDIRNASDPNSPNPNVAQVIAEDLTLPLPSIGVVANFKITPRLLAQVRSDFFYLVVGDYQGSMFEFYAGLEYRPFKYFGFGAAYDRLSVDVADNRDQGFRVDLAYNVVYLYGTIYMFDTPL